MKSERTATSELFDNSRKLLAEYDAARAADPALTEPSDNAEILGIDSYIEDLRKTLSNLPPETDNEDR